MRDEAFEALLMEYASPHPPSHTHTHTHKHTEQRRPDAAATPTTHQLQHSRSVCQSLHAFADYSHASAGFFAQLLFHLVKQVGHTNTRKTPAPRIDTATNLQTHELRLPGV